MQNETFSIVELRTLFDLALSKSDYFSLMDKTAAAESLRTIAGKISFAIEQAEKNLKHEASIHLKEFEFKILKAAIITEESKLGIRFNI